MIDFIIVIVSLLFSAFFSGMEIAYLSANKLKLELDIKKNNLSSKILSKLINKPSQYISTIILGNNIALVIYGIFMAKIILSFITPYISGEFATLLIQTILSTLIILFFAEFIPKTLFRTISNLSLKIFAVPLIIFFYMFKPIVNFMICLSRLILSKFANINIDDNTNEQVFGKIDIIDIIENSKCNSNTNQSGQEFKMIQNALDFSKIKLRECVVPRGDIQAVPYETELNDLIDIFIKTGFSNILVYKNNIDEIVGYINVKDIFKKPKNLSSVLRQVMIVPESMSAKNLFEQFIDNNKSLAVVVDEFGGTEGIVTIEDIIEEIFGDIEDEHDNPDFSPQITKDGNYIFSGRHEVDLINEEFGLNLTESEDYETIAGYVLYHYGNFPEEEDIIKISDDENIFKFKILKIQDTKIEKLMMFNLIES